MEIKEPVLKLKKFAFKIKPQKEGVRFKPKVPNMDLDAVRDLKKSSDNINRSLSSRNSRRSKRNLIDGNKDLQNYLTKAMDD